MYEKNININPAFKEHETTMQLQGKIQESHTRGYYAQCCVLLRKEKELGNILGGGGYRWSNRENMEKVWDLDSV